MKPHFVAGLASGGWRGGDGGDNDDEDGGSATKATHHTHTYHHNHYHITIIFTTPTLARDSLF